MTQHASQMREQRRRRVNPAELDTTLDSVVLDDEAADLALSESIRLQAIRVECAREFLALQIGELRRMLGESTRGRR